MNTYDLSIYQGETFNLSLTLKDDAGLPLNLSGYVISGIIKTKYSDTSALANLNVSVTNTISGNVSLNIPASGTSTLPVNYAFYDIEMTNTGDASVVKVLGGKVSIYPEVTF